MPSINAFNVDIQIANKTTTNVNGGQVATYTLQAQSVPALVRDASAQLRLVYAQRNIFIDKVAYLTVPVAVNTGDVVVFGGKNFFIHGVLDSSGTGRIFEIILRELTPGSIVFEN